MVGKKVVVRCVGRIALVAASRVYHGFVTFVGISSHRAIFHAWPRIGVAGVKARSRAPPKYTAFDGVSRT